MTDSKKSLSPEILPDPKRSAPSGSSPRDRVVRHVKHLLAGAAIGGVSVSAGCFTAVDPAPPPATCEDPWDAPDMAASAISADTTAGPVVDVLVVANRTDTTFAAPDHIVGGTLVSATPGRGSVSLVFTPEAGATELSFDVEATCAPTGNPPQPFLHVAVSLAASADGGNGLDVTVTRKDL